MLKLFSRFSRNQKLVMSFFVLTALLGSALAFFLNNTILIIGLFWLIAVLAFVVIMLIRRLNAKVSRISRGGSSVRLKKKVPKTPSRLNSQKPLEELERDYEKDKCAATALPFAKKLLQETGSISEAHRVLRDIPPGTTLHDDENSFIKRVKSLNKYLHEDYVLTQRHASYNYLPKRNKILYAVGMSPLSISNGYTSRTHGVATGLTAQGADVLVAPLPGKPWDKGPQAGFRVPKTQRRYLRQINGVNYSHNPGIRAWEGDLDIFFQVSTDAYVREAMIEKPEYILAASNYLSALPALAAARRLGIPFVYEMRGFWEVSAASVNPEWKNSDQYRFDRKFENFVAKQADQVVVITDEMRVELTQRGVSPEKIHVAPNCVDVETFAPLGKDLGLLKKLGFSRPELPVVGFAGSVTNYEGLDYVVKALSDIHRQGIDFNFLIIGGGKFLPKIKELVTELNLDDYTRYVKGIPNKQMPVYLSSIDIFPIARKSLPVTELVSPIKPLEAMAVGGAILLSDVSPHSVYFDERGERARSFTKDDLQSLTVQLKILLEASSDERKRMGTHARRWVRENRQWSEAGAVFRTALESAAMVAASEIAYEAERSLKSFTVAFIGDTFTADTFIPELTALQIRPDNWRDIYTRESIDALFIESAWMGNDGAWHGIVGYYSEEAHAPLVELIQHSRSLGIPVLFWNKEDPVHFNRFKRTAALCDYVFTTDARTIVDYNQLPDNVIQTVASAPFSAQPLLHNPLPSTRKKDESIAYGGTYYGDKYTTRKQGLDFLFYESAPYGLAIYERIHNDPNSPYKLPERFKRYARPSLSYPEMCEAYKAHPIHLNGNSVIDSPSMFSRRVVEISASGASVLSSPGRGVDETLAGTVPTVYTPDEAHQVLQGWKNSEQKRHRQVWAALRHVYEAHTSAHRLTYMLRVAGLRVRSPQQPKFAVECSSVDIQAFEEQTVRPDLYLVTDSSKVTNTRVPVVYASKDERIHELRQHGIDYVICAREELGTLGRHDVQDLVTALNFGNWKIVGKRGVRWQRNEPYVPIAANTADINDQVTLYDVDTYNKVSIDGRHHVADQDVFAWQVVRDDKPQASQRQTAKSTVKETKKLTVLLAGHDFKFFSEISTMIQQAGHKVLIDRWEGHNGHDEEFSRRMLAEADVIFCEWSLGNVTWYSHNKRPGQRLITRIHAQELRTQFLGEAKLENIDTFIFVSPAVMQRAQVLFEIPAEKCLVVGNTFDFSQFANYRYNINPKILGLVGSVPASKRLDLALDIVEGLRVEDPEFKLVVQGKEYTDYPWLLSRERETTYFEAQYQRISRSAHLQDGVIFAGHTSPIANWYLSEPGFILSTSDSEGTHQAIAEGGAAGCVPVIFPWAGAEAVYGDRWLVNSTTSAINRIRRLSANGEQFISESHAARDYMYTNFSTEVIGNQILDIIEA